jgi:DNA-binding NtrC family response regulator
MGMKRILYVESDAKSRARTVEALRTLQCEVTSLSTTGEAVHALENDPPSLVMAVRNEASEDDLRLIEHAHRLRSGVPVLVLARRGSTRGAIAFMDAGAYDYVAKPDSDNAIREMAENILRSAGALAVPDAGLLPEAGDDGPGAIVGRSAEMIEIFKMIGRIAKSDAAVLLQGESGTGKELAARTIHENSRRQGRPFVAINCAAIPETLLESELFGHEKGAFTGAVGMRRGKFEQCDGGTIFLDEIGDMSLATQAKILRVLQEKTFERVGGEESLTTDARVVTATNKSLVKEMRKNEFRVDLFYRLKVVSLFLPPLRQRHGDIRILAEHFLRKYAETGRQPMRGITRAALEMLQGSPWEGNVRELENAIQSAVVLNRTGVLDREDFPFLRQAVGGESIDSNPLESLQREVARASRALLRTERATEGQGVYRACMDLVEQTLVTEALRHCDGNQVRAARVLGISRNTLRSRMHFTRG